MKGCYLSFKKCVQNACRRAECRSEYSGKSCLWPSHMNSYFGILLIECVISFWGLLLSAGCFCIHSPLGSPISRNLEHWSLVNVVPTPPRPSCWWRSLQNVHVAKQGTSWRCGGLLRLAETTADVCRPALIRLSTCLNPRVLQHFASTAKYPVVCGWTSCFVFKPKWADGAITWYGHQC